MNMKELEKIEEGLFVYHIYEHWLNNERIYFGVGIKEEVFDFKTRPLHWMEKTKGETSEIEIKIVRSFTALEDAFSYIKELKKIERKMGKL